MSVRHTLSKIALATFGLALCATATQAQSDVKAEVNFLNGSKDFKALLKAEPTLSADRTLLLPDADGTLMLNANPGIGGTGMLYGVTGPQNTALVSTYLFNVQYVAGAGAATGALITSASTGAGAMGLDVVATGAGAGTATALRLASSGGTTNYALDVVTGGIRIQSTLPTTTTGTDGLVLEGGIVKTRTITSVDAGTVNNTTLRWDNTATKWVENTNVLATSTGDMTLNSATVKATTNQLILGTTNTTTISATAPAASAVYTIPDVGTTASFVMTEGTQTINGDKTLSGATSLTGVATAKAGVAIRFENAGGTAYTSFNAAAGQSSNISYTLPATGPSASQVLRANATTPTNLEWATLTQVDTGTTTNSTLRWSGTKWVENTNVLATSAGDVTTNTLTAKATTNQVILGTTNTTTISAAAPAASSVYTIPDVGTTGSFVMTEGTQTVNGDKTFGGATAMSTTLAVTGTTTLKGKSVLEPNAPADINGGVSDTVNIAATYVKQNVTANGSGSTKNVSIDAGTTDGQLLFLRLNITNATGTGKISIKNSNGTTIETVNTVDTKRFYQLMYSSADSQWMILSSQVIN